MAWVPGPLSEPTQRFQIPGQENKQELARGIQLYIRVIYSIQLIRWSGRHSGTFQLLDFSISITAHDPRVEELPSRA